jgi:hypothetical protein
VQLFVPQADLTQARELLESLLHSGDQVEPPIPETGQDEQGEA